VRAGVPHLAERVPTFIGDRMSSKLVISVFVAIAIVSVGAGRALAGDGPTLKPGKWEFTTTTEVPMLPEPKTTTKTECVKEEKTDPLAAFTKTEDCKVTDRTVNGNSMKWKVECGKGDDSPKVEGSGELTAGDTNVEGKMEMVSNLGGQEMRFKSSWKGKRLGDCD
jgi:hypothetical protein